MSLSGSFIRNIIAPLWAAKEGSPYLRHLKLIERMKQRAPVQVKADQWRQLKALLRHAVVNTTYYADRFDKAGIRIEELSNLDDFLLVPFLTKDDIRASSQRMIARNINNDRLVLKKTSGSTGVSLELYVDEPSIQWKRGVTLSYDRWAGWDLGEKIGALWGNPQHNRNWRAKLRNLLLDRYIFLDTLQMTEQSMMVFHQRLCSYRPVLLFGHAHSLFLFAAFMKKKGLSGVHPQGIISTCMVLHDFERATIEEVFGCRVHNRYGCEEVSLIACECSAHNGLHLNCDTLIVEFIRDGKPVKAGEPGAIVVTDLTNYGMPIIRYKVGDVGIPSGKTSCLCGCTYPLMDSVEGRVADYVVTPDGNYISGISLTENFAMHLPGVKQMQIIQEKIDRLTFRVVKGELFTDVTISDLKQLALKRFGQQMHFTIEYVEKIQSEQSGKYRFCISKVPNPFT